LYPEFSYASPELGSLVRSKTLQVAEALPHGKYKWKVEAFVGGSWSVTSPERLLTITPPLPAAPGLVNPANGAVSFSATPALSWNGVATAFKYQVLVDNSRTFTSPEYTGYADTTSHTLGIGLPAGTYYWRVRAVNEYDVPGAWSSYRSIRISAAVPALASPADAVTVSGIPRYTWLAVTGAGAYQFEFATNTAFTEDVYSSEDLTVVYHDPSSQPAGIYYWHVRAKDALGNWSGWSEARQIAIQ
jgi:predicted secreted protein